MGVSRAPTKRTFRAREIELRREAGEIVVRATGETFSITPELAGEFERLGPPQSVQCRVKQRDVLNATWLPSAIEERRPERDVLAPLIKRAFERHLRHRNGLITAPDALIDAVCIAVREWLTFHAHQYGDKQARNEQYALLDLAISKVAQP